jgi:hypothetical protein
MQVRAVFARARHVARIDHERIIASVSVSRKTKSSVSERGQPPVVKTKGEPLLAATRLLQYRSHEGFSAAAANVGALCREGEDHA